MVAAEVAFATSDQEKHFTTDELSESKFLKSSVLKYVNLCIIILILNKETVFTTEFFFTVGITISTTLTLMIFMQHTSNLTPMITSFVFRTLDGGCSKLKKEKDQNDPDSKEVNTKKVLQSELNKLYTSD
jgi:hypothetical protein